MSFQDSDLSQLNQFSKFPPRITKFPGDLDGS